MFAGLGFLVDASDNFIRWLVRREIPGKVIGTFELLLSDDIEAGFRQWADLHQVSIMPFLHWRDEDLNVLLVEYNFAGERRTALEIGEGVDLGQDVLLLVNPCRPSEPWIGTRQDLLRKFLRGVSVGMLLLIGGVALAGWNQN